MNSIEGLKDLLFPEFQSGDRVIVRRPSEEEPPFPCGHTPAQAWDFESEGEGYPPTTTLTAEVLYVGETEMQCGVCWNPLNKTVVVLDSLVGNLPGEFVASPTSLELIER